MNNYSMNYKNMHYKRSKKDAYILSKQNTLVDVFICIFRNFVQGFQMRH